LLRHIRLLDRAKLNTASISGGSEAAPEDAAQAADTGMFSCYSGDYLGGAVRAVVVDENHLPWHCAERTANRFRQHKDGHSPSR
jgi:hypothetical protein